MLNSYSDIDHIDNIFMMILYDTIWYYMILYDIIWYYMILYDIIWYYGILWDWSETDIMWLFSVVIIASRIVIFIILQMNIGWLHQYIWLIWSTGIGDWPAAGGFFGGSEAKTEVFNQRTSSVEKWTGIQTWTCVYFFGLANPHSNGYSVRKYQRI